MTTFALNNLWTYLQGLSLSQSDREWLAKKLIMPAQKKETSSKDESLEKFLEMEGIWSEDAEGEEYYQMMADCDVVLNPALKEGAVTTAFDAMAFGRPLVCIDTGGYTRYFKDGYAEMIPHGSRQQVVKALGYAILRLTERELRLTMGQKAQKAAMQITWEKKGEEIEGAIMGLYGAAAMPQRTKRMI